MTTNTRDAAIKEATPIYKLRLKRTGDLGDQPYVAEPENLVPIIRKLAADDGLERFGVLLFNSRNRLIGVVPDIAVGTVDSVLMTPAVVFGPALLSRASRVVVYHNHPSGESEPSLNDIAVTGRLVLAGDLLGVDVLDHIVVGDGTNQWTSVRRYVAKKDAKDAALADALALRKEMAS